MPYRCHITRLTRKAIHLSLLIIALLAMMLTATLPAGAVEVIEMQVTSDTADQYSPAIHGDRIVWEDEQFGLFNIYLFNAATGIRRQVTNDTAVQRDPAVFGDKIVWDDKRSIDPGIYLYDIPLGTAERMLGVIPENPNPAIHGNRVAWVDNLVRFLGNDTVYVYDYVAGTLVLRRTSGGPTPALVEDPAIYGFRVAWEEQRTSLPRDHTIQVYSLATNSTEWLRGVGHLPMMDPALCGDRVVFVTGLSRVIGQGVLGREIYVYDFLMDTFRRTTTDFYTSKRKPAFYGNRIVWEDYRNGNWDIYLYDLATETETQITTDTADQTQPVVYGDRVVWTDARNGNLDIYMATLVRTPGELLREQVQELIGDINELYSIDVLNNGQRVALTKVLEQISLSIGRDDMMAASNQANAFINQVRAYTKAGVLSENVSGGLIKSVTPILEELGS